MTKENYNLVGGTFYEILCNTCEFMEVDIGDLNYADSFVVSVEDENGVFVEY